MSCKGWGCFVSSPDADRMRRLESRDYSCKPELQARDFSREKLTIYHKNSLRKLTEAGLSSEEAEKFLKVLGA